MVKFIKKDLISSDKDVLFISKEIDSIEIKKEHQGKQLSHEAQHFIEENWTKFKNKHNFDGAILDVNGIRIENKKAVLFCDDSTYKLYKTTKMKEYNKYINEGNYFSNHLSCGVVLKTLDDKLIFPVHENSLKLLGGFFDPHEDKTCIDCIKRELKEEIGLSEITEVTPRVLFFSSIHHYTGLVFTAKVNQNSQSLYNSFLKQKEKEFHDLIILNKNESIPNNASLSVMAQVGMELFNNSI